MRIDRRIGWLLLLTAGCGSRGPVRSAPDESRPHITWEIRRGGEFGDAQVVCGSPRPEAPCTLTASTADRRTVAMLRLYLHPVTQQTNYVGVWRAPFLEGWTAKDSRDVSGTVKPGGPPYEVSVSGIVTSKPGTYALSVALDGAQEQVPNGTRITLDIPVTVTP